MVVASILRCPMLSDDIVRIWDIGPIADHPSWILRLTGGAAAGGPQGDGFLVTTPSKYQHQGMPWVFTLQSSTANRKRGALIVPYHHCSTTGPQEQAGPGMGARGGGRVEGRGAGGGAHPQPDVQPVRCIPPGTQQMPAHHTHHRHHHQHHLYNIDPDAGKLVPPQPSRPRHQPAPPAPRAGPARMASAGRGQGTASAPQAQGQQGEPAQGVEGARPWDRDWGTVPDPLGDEALPLVGEVYGWLSWANQDHQGDEEPALECRAPPEGWRKPRGSPGGVGSPRGPREGPQVSDLGGVGKQGADVAGLPGRGSGAPHHGCGHQQLGPLGLAQRPRQRALPPAQPAAATAPAPTQAAAQMTAQTADARKEGGGAGPPDPRPPCRYGVTKERAPPPAGGRAETTSAGGNLLPRSPLTADR